MAHESRGRFEEDTILVTQGNPDENPYERLYVMTIQVLDIAR